MDKKIFNRIYAKYNKRDNMIKISFTGLFNIKNEIKFNSICEAVRYILAIGYERKQYNIEVI
jgi:hypothetical protein